MLLLPPELLPGVPHFFFTLFGVPFTVAYPNLGRLDRARRRVRRRSVPAPAAVHRRQGLSDEPHAQRAAVSAARLHARRRPADAHARLRQLGGLPVRRDGADGSGLDRDLRRRPDAGRPELVPHQRRRALRERGALLERAALLLRPGAALHHEVLPRSLARRPLAHVGGRRPAPRHRRLHRPHRLPAADQLGCAVDRDAGQGRDERRRHRRLLQHDEHGAGPDSARGGAAAGDRRFARPAHLPDPARQPCAPV